MKKLWQSLVEKWQLRKEYKQRDKERKLFKDSEEPWVSIIGGQSDPEKGLKLDLDWNDAFIQMLRLQGVKGIKDEDVVAFWLTTLHQSNMTSEEFGDIDGTI